MSTLQKADDRTAAEALRQLPHLPDEVIANIIPYLQQPLPRPTGKNERSAVRQNALATCMRVSPLFNNLAAPLLYSTIITDFLPSLTYCCFDESEAHPLGIQSKMTLLQNMKRLYLEYDSKDTPSYSTLLRHGGHYFTLIEANLYEMAQVCAAECDWIAASADVLAAVPQKLVSLATGAFLGGQREIWYPIACEGKPKPNPFEFPGRAGESRSAITALCTNPRLAYFCQRVEYGPLVFEQVPWLYEDVCDPPGLPTLQHRSHFELDYGCVPVIMAGGASRWYCPYNSPDRDPGLDKSIDKLTHWMTGHLQDRETAFSHMVKEDAEWMMKKGPSVNVDVYLPKSMVENGALERVDSAVQTHKSELEWLLGLPEARCKGDVWKVHSLEEAPPCEGCDWMVEDMESDSPVLADNATTESEIEEGDPTENEEDWEDI